MATKTHSNTKVAPLADRVVVRALEETEQMRGGLFIPDTAKEKPQQGEIIAVGPGRYEKDVRVPMEPRNYTSTPMRARLSSAASTSSLKRSR
jgi:hypothetical protein